MAARFTKRVAKLAKRMKGDLSEAFRYPDERTFGIMKAKSAGLWEFIENRISRRRWTDLMAVGRYVLSADIWAELERNEPGAQPHPAHRCHCRTGENSRLTRC